MLRCASELFSDPISCGAQMHSPEWLHRGSADEVVPTDACCAGSISYSTVVFLILLTWGASCLITNYFFINTKRVRNMWYHGIQFVCLWHGPRWWRKWLMHVMSGLSPWWSRRSLCSWLLRAASDNLERPVKQGTYFNLSSTFIGQGGRPRMPEQKNECVPYNNVFFKLSCREGLSRLMLCPPCAMSVWSRLKTI